MISILFVVPAFSRQMGGGERYVYALAQALTKRGHNIHVLTSHAKSEDDFWHGTAESEVIINSEDNIIVMRCPIKPAYGGYRSLMARRKLMLLVSKLPFVPLSFLKRFARQFPTFVDLNFTLTQLPITYDVIHAFNLSWEYPALLASQYAQKHHIPFFITPYAHLNADGSNRAAHFVTMPHQRQILNQADAVLTLTQNALDGLKQWGVACRQSGVLGAGLDPVPPLTTLNQIKQTYQVRPPYMIFVGRLTESKGAMDAVRAVLSLEEVSLVLVGTSTPEFEQFYAQLLPAQQSRIHCVGRVSEQEKHTLIYHAHALLLPSKVDALGLVILEAWYHQVPIIGVRAGGIPEVIDDGVNGLLVEAGNVPALSHAIYSLWQDDQLRSQLGKEGYIKVQSQYQWHHVAAHLLKYYENVEKV